MVTAPDLPERPDYSSALHFRGDGLVIPKGQWMNLTGDASLGVSEAEVKKVKASRIRGTRLA